MMKKHSLALIFLAMANTPQASAHVVLADPVAVPGSYYAGFFRVSHGCGESGTVSLRIEIPKGINNAKPQPKAGWTVATETEKLATPIKTEGGGQQTLRVTAITWKGSLPADQFDQFGVMMKLPAQFAPLYFPTVQTCEKGERRWVEIAPEGKAWNSVPSPAPMLHLEESSAGMDGMAGMDHSKH